MDKNTRFDLNLSKWMAIALVLLSTGLIVQTASASPKYRSFILSWIDPEPTDGQSCVSYASGRLLEPNTFDQGVWKSPGNIKTLREGGIHPVCELESDGNYKAFLLAGKYLIVLSCDDVHHPTVGYNSNGANDKIQEILSPYLPDGLFIEAMHFEQRSFSQPSLRELYQNEKNIDPPIVLGYVGGISEIIHWLPFISFWKDWSDILQRLLISRDDPSIKAFFTVFNSLPPQEQGFVLYVTNPEGFNSFHFASQFRNADILSTLLDACSTEHREKLLTTQDKNEWNPLHYAARYQSHEGVRLVSDALNECGCFEEAASTKNKGGFYPADLSMDSDHSKEVFPLLVENYHAPFSKVNAIGKAELKHAVVQMSLSIVCPLYAPLGAAFVLSTLNKRARKPFQARYRNIIFKQHQSQRTQEETHVTSQSFRTRTTRRNDPNGEIQPLLQN